MLIAIFFMALLVISLAVAAPNIARSIQRDRDLETFHRGMQYRRAIQLYYRKFHAYPPNVDALVNTNDIRFLRKKYVDPITGKDDWKPIAFGQNKTPTAMGFFGQPLAGNASTLAGIGPSGGWWPARSRKSRRIRRKLRRQRLIRRQWSFVRRLARSSPTDNSGSSAGHFRHRQLDRRHNPRRHFIHWRRNRHQLQPQRPNLRRRGHHRLLPRQPQRLDSRLQEEASLQRVGVHLRPALRHANRRRRQHWPDRPARQQHHHSGGHLNFRLRRQRTPARTQQAPAPCRPKPPRSSLPSRGAIVRAPLIRPKIDDKTQKARPIRASLCIFSLLAPLFPRSLVPCFYTWNDEPHPHVDFTWGFSNLNPAASSVST